MTDIQLSPEAEALLRMVAEERPMFQNVPGTHAKGELERTACQCNPDEKIRCTI